MADWRRLRRAVASENRTMNNADIRRAEILHNLPTALSTDFPESGF
jgi:hypothetical protein